MPPWPRRERQRGYRPSPPFGPCDGARLRLLDHLVRAQQNRWGYGKAERRGGRDDKAAYRLAPKGDDGRFNLYLVMNGRSDCLDVE